MTGFPAHKSRRSIEELRTAVAAMRVLAGLSASTFTDTPIIPQSTIIKRVHVTELRTALDAARSGIGLAPPAYTDGTITAGTTVMKAVHVSELRDGTQ